MNITKTCRDLGYPCRMVLSRWLDERISNKKSVLKGSILKKYSYNDNVVASIRLVCRDNSAKDVAEEIGVSLTSLYKWKKQLVPQGERLIMSDIDNNYEGLQDQITDFKKRQLIFSIKSIN